MCPFFLKIPLLWTNMAMEITLIYEIHIQKDPFSIAMVGFAKCVSLAETSITWEASYGILLVANGFAGRNFHSYWINTLPKTNSFTPGNGWLEDDPASLWVVLAYFQGQTCCWFQGGCIVAHGLKKWCFQDSKLLGFQASLCCDHLLITFFA